MTTNPKTEKYISYITKHKINKTNSFINSLVEQYEQKGYLTKKQTECLLDTYLDHNYVRRWFMENQDKCDCSQFYESLRDFFFRKNYLSQGQKKYLSTF